MARCPNCNDEVPAGARFCPHCGIAQPKRPPRPEQQPPLPFSPWGPPQAAQPAGAGALPRAEPAVGPPLPIATVAIAVGAILLFVVFVIAIGRGGLNFGLQPPMQAGGKSLPVVGVRGEAVNVGKTTWGAAFIDEIDRIDSRLPQQGQFFAVGIVVGNRGDGSLELSTTSVGLIDERSGRRYTPTMTAWGTPDQITGGQYSTRFVLPPRKAIAGLIVFDVPKETMEPRLLVRDLTTSSPEFTAEIDLTKEKPPEQRSESDPVQRSEPVPALL